MTTPGRSDHASSDSTLSRLSAPGVKMRQLQNRVAHLEAERSTLRRNVAELLAEFTELRDRAVTDAAEIERLREALKVVRTSRRLWMRYALSILRDNRSADAEAQP